MGFLDKIMFWKHEDDLDFDQAADKELGLQDEFGLDQEPLGPDRETAEFAEKSPFEPKELPPHLQEAVTPERTTPPGAVPAAPSGANRDLELISSKLDTVKAILTSMDQRIANLEKAAGVERKERLW